jgi:hypothetical protein
LRASPRGHQAFGALTAFRRATDGPPHLPAGGNPASTKAGRAQGIGSSWALCALLEAFLTLHVVLVLPSNVILLQTNKTTDKVDPEVLVAQWAKKKLLQLRSAPLESETRVTFMNDVIA